MDANTPGPMDGHGTPVAGPVGTGPAPARPQTPTPAPASAVLTAAAYGFAMPWAGMGVVFGTYMALMVAAFSGLGASFVVVIVLASAALAASAFGAWWLGRTALTRGGGRAPKTVAWLGTGCFVLSAFLFYGGSAGGYAAAEGAAAGLAGGAGCALVELSPRLRLPGIAVAVVGALAAQLALPPLIEWYEARSERSAAMGDPDEDFAVLDGPDWTRTGIGARYERLNLYYEHRDGDEVRVETWNGGHDEPVDFQCDYRQMECERRDGLVIVREEGEIGEVRTVLPDGTVVAVLPAQYGDEADLVAAAQDVRPGTQEDRERIIDSAEE